MSFTPCVCVRCRVDNSNSSSLKRVVKSFGMHCTVLFFVHITKEKNTVLRPAAQLYGQVPTDWNQCFVIDCSVSHSAGHKPFTCSHSVVRNTWLNIHAVCWMRFSSHLSVHVFTILRNLTWFFFVSSAVSELSSAWYINCFLRYVCCWIFVKDKSLSVLMVDRCCRFASLKPVQNSWQ